MKCNCLFMCAIFLCFGDSIAQKNKIEVKSDEDLKNTVNSSFRFPYFQNGITYFKNGTTTSAMLNYNMLLGEIEFIDAKGDTLTIANEESIEYLTIGENIFYYNKGILEQLAAYKTIKLGMKEKIELADRQKTGGYGQPTSAGSISNYSSMSSTAKHHDLQVNQTFIYKKYVSYYLILNNGKGSFLANKNGFMKAFPGRKKDIEQYLDQTRIDFKNEEDLKNLLTYLDNGVN